MSCRSSIHYTTGDATQPNATGPRIIAPRTTEWPIKNWDDYGEHM